jgi:hypothetical protein
VLADPSMASDLALHEHLNYPRLSAQPTQEMRQYATEKLGELLQTLHNQHAGAANSAAVTATEHSRENTNVPASVTPDADNKHERDIQEQSRHADCKGNPPRVATPPTPIIEPFETRWAKVPKIDGSIHDLYEQWGKHSTENARLMLEMLIPAWRNRPFEDSNEEWDHDDEANKILELRSSKLNPLETTLPTNTG